MGRGKGISYLRRRKWIGGERFVRGLWVGVCSTVFVVLTHSSWHENVSGRRESDTKYRWSWIMITYHIHTVVFFRSLDQLDWSTLILSDNAQHTEVSLFDPWMSFILTSHDNFVCVYSSITDKTKVRREGGKVSVLWNSKAWRNWNLSHTRWSGEMVHCCHTHPNTSVSRI